MKCGRILFLGMVPQVLVKNIFCLSGNSENAINLERLQVCLILLTYSDKYLCSKSQYSKL